MSIGGIGSTPSFWQQDQSYWQQAQENDNSTAATNSVIDAISSAETNLGKGLASIANATALNRVNSQITAIVEQALQPASGSSSSSSSGSGSSSSAGSSASGAASSNSPTPATGTGTAVLTTGASLSTLGILPGGTITVGTGPNTTTYTSTGTDTIADLINAINVDLPTNANVTASLDTTGQLVITSRDDSSAIYIGGSGTDAAAIGFGAGNNTFLPKSAPSSAGSSAASSSTSSTTNASTGSSSTGSASSATSAAKSTRSYTTLASEIAGSAASILSDSGVGGTLIDMLA